MVFGAFFLALCLGWGVVSRDSGDSKKAVRKVSRVFGAFSSIFGFIFGDLTSRAKCFRSFWRLPSFENLKPS